MSEGEAFMRIHRQGRLDTKYLIIGEYGVSCVIWPEAGMDLDYLGLLLENMF